MKNIFKYTFLQRLPVMFRYMSVLLGMVVIEALFLQFTSTPFAGFYAVWLGVTFTALIVVPVFHIGSCSGGYARRLLFTNESYLMLTLPIRSDVILIGRILAGFTELVIVFAFSVVMILIMSSWCGTLLNPDFYFWEMQKDMFYFVLVKNYKAFLTVVVLVLNGAFFIGSLSLFVHMVVRSFTVKRRKGLITVVAIAGFVGLVFLLGKIETLSYDVFAQSFSVPVYNYIWLKSGRISGTTAQMHVPAVSALAAFVCSVCLCFFSAYLLEKRVEV